MPCPTSTDNPTLDVPIGPGVTIESLLAVCPEGVGFYNESNPQYWDGNFQCQYPNLSITFNNQYQHL